MPAAVAGVVPPDVHSDGVNTYVDAAIGAVHLRPHGNSATNEFVVGDGTLGAFGVAPAARAGAYALAGPAASRNLAAPTAVAPGNTAATQVTPWGYSTQAQADGVRATAASLVTDVANIQAVLRQLIADMQAYGLAQ